MPSDYRKHFLCICITFLVVAFVHPGNSTPISAESVSPANPEGPVKCTKNSTSASGAAEPEPEHVPEPKPSSHEESNSKPVAASLHADKPKETETSAASTTTTTTTTAKSAEAHTTATTTKPPIKAATTAPTTTTVKPTAALKITEKVKTEAVVKPVESAPLKVESREGKALNLNKTEYEHDHASAEPEPEPESSKPHSGNGTEHKVETMKKDGEKKDEKPAGTHVVHETVEKKNASMVMEGKKSDEKAPGHVEAKKEEPAKDGSTNSSAKALPTAAAKTNGSPASANLGMSFLSLSFIVISAKGVLS